MSNLPKLPDLGQFFGDQGGPGMTTPNTPQNENRPSCPFVDEKMGEFCILDSALCPFVGFNYRRCRKYTNNMAKGNMKALEPSANNASGGGPPRVEGRRLPVTSLTEARRKAAKKPAKKRGSKKAPSIAGIRVSDLPPDVQAFAGHIAHTELDPGGTPDPEKKRLVKRFLTTHRTPDVAAMYYTPDDPEYKEQGRQSDLLAAALHLIHGISPGKAKQMGADFAAIAHAEAGERFRASDQVARDIAHGQATSSADATAAMFHGNPQSHRPKGGPTTDDPEDIETKRAARSAPPSGGPPPPPEGEYAPEHPGVKKPKRKFGFRVRHFGTRHERPGTRPFPREPEAPKEKKVPREPYRGMERGFAKQSTKGMTYEQFDQFVTDHIESLRPQELKDVLAGMGKPGAVTKGELIGNLRDMAGRAADQKNYKSIADSYKRLWGRIEGIRGIQDNERKMRRAWDANLRLLSKIPLGDRRAYALAIERTKKNPEALGKIAGFMNKLMDRAYDLETRTMKIGKNELTTFVRHVTLPEFKRSDYEVIRMAEQMGLAAIQKQHQYGRGYGRWNTWMLFFKQVLAPFTLWATGNAKIIKPLMSLWPTALFDQFYFAYIKRVLPKLRKGGTGELQAARDIKFLGSQKMATGRHKRIMRGWERDALLPPDVAVLHTRWYPTTKETWGKRRQGELAQRYQKTKALPPKVTRKSFL